MPPSAQPNRPSYPGLTAAWLAQARRRGWLPAITVTTKAATAADLRLAVLQWSERGPESGRCRQVSSTLDLQLPKGAAFWEPAAPTAKLALLRSFTVRSVGSGGRPTGPEITMRPAFGARFTVEASGLTLRIAPVSGGSIFPLVICH